MDTHVHYKVTVPKQPIPDYRPLVEAPAGRYIAPARCTVAIDVEGEPGLGRVVLELVLIDRRYQIVHLDAIPPEGSGLDIEALRRLPVARFARSGVEHRVRLEHVEGETYSAESPMEHPDPLWPVALTYSMANALGEAPTAAVAEALGISHGAAAQRVKRAREAGYLPATTQGRAS